MKAALTSSKTLILLDQAIFSGTSFIATVIVARLLNIDTFGAYSGYLLGIYLVLSGVSAFVMQPFQVLLAKCSAQKAYIAFVFWLQLALITALLLTAWLFTQMVPGALPGSLLLYAAGFLMHDFGRRLLLALNRPLQTLLFDATASAVTLVALYLFSKTSHTHALEALYSYTTVAYAFSTLVLLGMVQPLLLNKAALAEHLPQHLREGKWLFMTALSQWWSSNMFVVASALYLGAAALGALRLAQSLMGVLNVLLQTFENYVLPQTAIKINALQADGIAYAAAMSKKAGLLFIPVLVITFLFASPIMVLAGGAAYASFAFVLQGMALLYVLIFISQPIRLLIRALLLNQHFFYGYLLSIAFSLLCSQALLKGMGLQGALIGLAGSQLLVMVYWSLVLQHKKINLWKSFISF